MIMGPPVAIPAVSVALRPHLQHKAQLMNPASRLSVFLFATTLILNSRSFCPADEAGDLLTEAQKRGGWKLLFDGKTTNGWRNYRSEQMSDG